MNSVTKYLTGIFLLLIIFVFISCKDNTIEPVFFGSIEGIVLDAVTGAPVNEASVSTTPPSNAIVTNSQGKYFIEDIPVGEYTISVKKNGYKKATVTVSVREDAIAKADTHLEKDDGSNLPPQKPSNPSPANEAVDQPVSITLKWSAADPDADDSLSYNIYLYESNMTSQKSAILDHADTSVVIENLKYSTTYFWQVTVKDSSGAETNGSMWSFKTAALPALPFVYASNRSGNYEIYLSDSLSAFNIKLTDDPGRDWMPRFSPRGDMIAFTSSRDNETQLYRMNADGSDLFRITSVPVAGNHNNGFGFCWSADGSRLIYSNYDKLYSININGGSLTLLASAPQGRNFRECSFSPTGDKIVVLAIGQNIFDSEIYIMNADGSGMTMLIDNLPGIIQSPVFSPDGKSILYTKDISGHEVPEGRQLNSHIFLFDLNAKTEVDLSSGKPDGTNDLYPRFSPDGAKVIFTSVNNTGSGVRDVYTLQINESGLNRGRSKIISDAEMADWR